MHPALDRLDAFSRGDLAETEAEAIEEHLAVCAACVQTLEAASRDDALVELLRTANQQTFVIAPVLSHTTPYVPPDLPAGYEILEPIGRGGMGVVYKANQRALGRVVALKQIRTGMDADAKELARFRIEAEAAARLIHPNIVQVYDVGLRDGTPFFAMELVEGGSLAARLRKAVLRPREAATLVGLIARAIHYAHENGVVHRDLKPGNILLAPDGTPKVVDFGLAKRLDVTGGETLAGDLLGTPSYMSPEQAEGRAVGPATDTYALGAILYECLTGRPPFHAATPLEILEQVRSCEPPSMCQLQPDIPRDLQTICLTCLQKEPWRRYATAEKFADDLDRFLRGEPITARPIGFWERGLKWARRRPAHAALAGLGLATAIATVAGLAAHDRRLRIEVENTRQAANEARTQRTLADTNYREARDAIRRILEQINEPKYRGTPRSSELRQSQADAALQFYDRVLASSDSPDPVVRLDTALALREAANLQIGLGRFEPAERNLKRSLQLLDSLAAAKPNDVGLMLERMTTWLKLGVMLMNRDNTRSLEALETANSFAKRLVQVEGNSWKNRANLAWCEDNIGSTLIFANKSADAERHYAGAAELRRALVREQPQDVGQRVELAGTLVNLGLVQPKDRASDAEALYAEAAELLEAAVKIDPDEPAYSLPLASLLTNWGNLAAGLGKPELALERLTRGLSLVEPTLITQPALSDYRLTALNLHGSRGNLLGALGRYGEAVADWDRVLALNDVPANETGYRVLRLVAMLKAGDHVHAVVEIERVAKPATGANPLSDADMYNIACFYALASGAAANDKGLGLTERDRLAEAYAQRAFDWLRRCAMAGFLRDRANRDHARQDSDLEVIRGRAEFLSIIEAESSVNGPEAGAVPKRQ